jgi:peptidoglycan/LPS O-acetylase OafA/YrhL
MDAAKTSTGRYYRPELDVLRFVAFLLVFFHHSLSHMSSSGFHGVVKVLVHIFIDFVYACRFGLSLFFTLSAFLICELLLRERATAGGVAVKQFYIRRILRIWPLYYFGLALGVAYTFLPIGHGLDAAKLGWFAIFLGAWYNASHAILVTPANVLWSISVEEQFYLFAPWVIKYFNRRRLFSFCGVIIVATNLFLIYMVRKGYPSYSAWYNSVVQFECFAGGVLLCLVLRSRTPHLAIWSRLLFVTGCGIFWMIANHWLFLADDYAPFDPIASWFLMGGYALITLGCVLLLLAFLGVAPGLLPQRLIYLGRISFGLYVYHDFFIFMIRSLSVSAILNQAKLAYPLYIFLFTLLTIGLPLGLTVLAAALSYRYFEMPFLKMKKRYAAIESQPIAGAS